MGFAARIGLVLLLVSASARADDTLPWHFGMTPAEVRNVSTFGPYQAFSNGDLETYRGIFEGREENVQFFFSNGSLRRIGYYLYEGADVHSAANRWLSLYDSLSVHYGRVNVPGAGELRLSTPDLRAEFGEHAAKVALVPGKSQMAPEQQPQDASTFASFWGSDLDGVRTYYVVLYFDRRP